MSNGEEKTIELYRKYRPKTFKEIIGQEEAVYTLVKMIKEGRVPHCILITGPSGVGKTTLARILKSKLGCNDLDFVEINAAESRGIDTVREIDNQMRFAPFFGNVRVWVIDECHRLTQDAQSALLKILEDTPSHVYFFLCTTDENKLLNTIRTRASEIKLRSLKADEIVSLVKNIAEKEGKPISEDVADEIAKVSEGSARKALVLLHSVLGEDEETQISIVSGGYSAVAQAIDLARVLMKPGSRWMDVVEVLKKIEEIENRVDEMRRIVLSYAVKVLLSGKNCERAANVIASFTRPWYESRYAGLVLACYDVVNNG